MNPMQRIRLAKVTLNMGAGDNHQRLESSQKVLAVLSGRKPVVTKTRKRTTFGPAKGKEIGAKVTVRGTEAQALLKRLMEAVEGRLKPTQFDAQGNFSFGITEYIHIPGASYDPDIGILGLDVAVTLEKPGHRVSRRKLRPSAIGKGQRIAKAEAMAWAREFGFAIAEEAA